MVNPFPKLSKDKQTNFEQNFGSRKGNEQQPTIPATQKNALGFSQEQPKLPHKQDLITYVSTHKSNY